MPALKAANHIRALAEPVDKLALAFIPPLRANNHNIRHFTIRPYPQARMAGSCKRWRL